MFHSLHNRIVYIITNTATSIIHALNGYYFMFRESNGFQVKMAKRKEKECLIQHRAAYACARGKTGQLIKGEINFING